jgi:hypothetical protein
MVIDFLFFSFHSYVIVCDDVTNVTISSRTNTSVTIKWNAPDYARKYIYTVTLSSPDLDTFDFIQANVTNASFTFVNMTQGIKYTALVLATAPVAINNRGLACNISSSTAAQINITSAPAAPMGNPRDVTLVSASDTSVFIAWQPPALAFRGSVVLNYEVSCWRVSGQVISDLMEVHTQVSVNVTGVASASH